MGVRGIAGKASIDAQGASAVTDGIENTPIVVVGNVPSNPFELMSDFMPRARADPSQIVMIFLYLVR